MRIAASAFALVVVSLLVLFVWFIWVLFGDNWDFPPTWYWALTVLLTVLDIGAACYLLFKVVRVLTRKSSAGRLARVVLVLALLLGMFHAATVYVYSNIPQWDFQDDLFSDLSPPSATISSSCRDTLPALTPNSSTPSPSLTRGAPRPISYDELRRIASVADYSWREVQFSNRTISAWHGWIQDLSSHVGGGNPDKRVVAAFLHDPYAISPAGDAEQRNNGFPEVELYNFKASDVEQLTVGQEILICQASISAYTYYRPGDTIGMESPVVNPLPLPAQVQSTTVAPDFLVEYAGHGCGKSYPCPDYKVAIDAQGNITYHGYNGMGSAQGDRHAQASPEKLRQLAFELQRTHFLSLTGFPDRTPDDPAGTITLTARLNGTTKTVVVSLEAGQSMPEAMQMLIGKITEVSNLRQWVVLAR